MDRGIIKRLAYAIHDWMRGVSLPTNIPVMAITCCMDALLELLEAQEPKLVKLDADGDDVLCPSCGNRLFPYPLQKYCDECGQAVKWDGE